MAPHFITLAWKIPGTEEPGRLQSMGSLESDTTERLHFHFSLACIGEGNGNPLQCSCLENPRDGEPGGLRSMGSHRVGHDWSDLAAAAAAITFAQTLVRVELLGCHFKHLTSFTDIKTRVPHEDKYSGLLYTSEQPECFQGMQVSLDPDLYNVHLVRESESCSVVSDSLRTQGLHSPWNSVGQNTGVGSLSLLQGIFGQIFSFSRHILYQLSHMGSPSQRNQQIKCTQI